ncbi:MAG: hypothetical protein U0903_07645 [Planctomycetales bacterium]
MRRLLFSILVTIAACTSPLVVLAADAPKGSPPGYGNEIPPFQTWLLPPDLLQKQLTADWIPVPLEEFEQWVRKNLRNVAAQTPCSVKHAEYTATFAEGELRSGTALWKIQRSGTSVSSFSLSPLNIALHNVTWHDRPALCGTSPGNLGLCVLVDRQTGDLQGEWESVGKREGRNYLFDLQFPSAQVTTLNLRTPQGWKIQVADPQSIVTSQKSDTEIQWQILLGNKQHCELTVSPTDDGSALPAQFSYQQDNLYLIGPEGLRMRTSFKLNVARGNLASLLLLMDRDLQVVSVNYGGDLPLNWKTKDVENDRILEIDLPEPMASLTRPLQVLMHSPVRLSQDWRLPVLRMKGGLEEENLFRLQPQSPLEIKNITSVHCRQTATDPAEEVLFVYRATRADASLTVNIGNPPLKAVARVSGYVRIEREAWLADYEVEWEASSGIEYSLPIKIQPGWEIIDVHSVHRRGIPEAVAWELQSLNSGAGQQLRINLQDPLRPGAPQRFLLQMRRPVSAIDKAFPLPYLEPYLVDDLSMLLLLTSDPQLRVILEPDTSFEVLESSQIPAPWAANPFWSQQTRIKDNRQLLLRLNAPSPKGDLSLRSTETLLASQGLVDARWSDDQIHEDFSITVHPRNSRVDKVLVYLTESGGSPSWKLEPAGEVSLDATRLPASRHGAWEVKPSGELWELRLSIPQNGPFVIRGSRSRPQTAQGRMTQIFLPQSETFEGEVRLQLPRQSELRFEPTGGDLVEGGTDQANSGPERQMREVSWKYRKLEDQLSYRADDFRLRSDALLSAVLDFSIRMGLPSSSPDVFQARYLFPTDIPLATFRWQLPTEVQILDVLVDGKRNDYTRDDDGFSLAGMDRLRGRTVQITYASPASPAQDRTIFIPRTALPVSRTEWNLYLSDGLAIQKWPRELGTPDRNPGSVWNQLWPSQSALKRDVTLASEESPPSGIERPGDTLWQSMTVSLPEKVQIQLWDRHRLTLLAWQSLLGSLLFWLVLRLTVAEKVRNFWLLRFLWIGFLTAFWLPHGWSFVMWSVLTGSLISSLAPLWWLPPAWRSNLRKALPTGPLPSTHLQSQSQIGLTILMMVLTCTCSTSAQTPPAPPPNGPQATSKTASADQKAPLWKVMIPADESGKPLGQKPIVYLSPEWQKWIEQQSVAPSVEPQYFIHSAKYALKIPTSPGNGPLAADQGILAVTYEIDLPRQSVPIKVSLPLSGIGFLAKNPCRVNGQPAEIYSLPQGKGIYLWMTSESPQEPAGEKQKSDASSTNSPAPKAGNSPSSPDAGYIRRTLELNCVPRFTQQESLHTCEVQTPEVADSRLALEFSNSPARCEIVGARGPTTLSEGGIRRQVQLGPTTSFQIRWLETPLPVTPPGRAELTAYGLADVSPLLTTVRYRLEVQPTEGELEHLTLLIPAQAILRELKGTVVSQYRETGSENGDNRILVEFIQPQKNNVTLELLFAIPTGESGEECSLPPIRLLDAQQNPEIRLFAHQVALRASPEYLFEASSDVGEHSIPITIDSFLEAWGKETARPQAAFRILDAVPLKFFLRQQTTTRKIEALKYQGTITPLRANVVWEADIEIGALAPAYQHHLDVDSQIQIQQISVVGDDANRLLYWTRTGNRVSLYLRERTIGRQKIRVEGRFPLKIPGDFDWPEIKLLNSIPGREEWQLAMLPEISAEVVLSDGFRRLANSPEDNSLTQGQLVLGTYEVASEKRRLRLRLQKNVPKLSCLTLTTIEQRESNWKFGIQLQYRVQEGVGTQFELSVPDSLPQFQVEARDARVLQKKQPDGSSLVTFLLKSPTRDLFQASVTADIPIPRESLWNVPSVVPLQVLTHTSYLLVNPPELLDRNAEGATGLREARQLPELQRLAPAVLISQSRVFEGTSGPWTLPLKGHSTTVSQAPISWVEDLVWIDSGNTLHGRTQILISASPLSPLEFSLPKGVRLEHVEVNGLVHAVHQKEGRSSIDFERSQSTAVISIDWAEESPRNWSRRLNLRLLIPRLLSYVPKTRHLVLMRSASTLQLETTRRLNTRWWTWTLSRLETLKEMLSRHGREERSLGITLRKELDDLQGLVDSGLVKAPTGSLQTRYADLKRTTHELEIDELAKTSRSKERDIPEILAGLRDLTPESVLAFELAGGSDQFQLWQIDHAWLLVPLTLLILILGRNFTSWIARWSWSSGPERSPAWGWLLCACGWAIFLTPTWFALFFALLAGLHAFSGATPPPPAEETPDYQLQEV